MANTHTRNKSSSADIVIHDENLSPTSVSTLDRVQTLLASLASERFPPAESSYSSYVDIQCDRLRELQVILIDSSHRFGRVKDDFRRFGGFDIIVAIVGQLGHLASRRSPQRDVFELLKVTLHVLSEVLSEHDRNRSFFNSCTGRQGWQALEENIKTFRAALDVHEHGNSGQLPAKLFDILFGFALREGESSNVFRSLSSNSKELRASSSGSKFPSNESSKTSDKGEFNSSDKKPRSIILWYPEITPIILRVLGASSIVKQHNNEPRPLHGLIESILSALDVIHSHSHYNAVALLRSGSLDPLLHMLFSGILTSDEQLLCRKIAMSLLQLGCTSPHAALEIFNAASYTPQASDVLATCVTTAHEPAHFVLDSSLYGHASLELATIRGNFPPNERAGGFTLMTWFRIDEFDPKCHTTLFGAFDQTQECFVLLYLERESRQLVLQTSISSERPSVRFKSLVFRSGTWYHIAVVQRSPRPDGLSRASLLVNGELRERVKCVYPQRPKSTSSSTTKPSSRSTTPSFSEASVQAFVGTPKGLAPRLGTNVLTSRWSIASCQLILTALQEDLIFVYFNLGPRYVGNFQDSLGSFQTYRTSTALNLRNELSQGQASERSVVAKAIKSKAGNINEESNFAINLIAASVPTKEFRRLLSICQAYKDDNDSINRQHNRQPEEWEVDMPYNLGVFRVSDEASQLAASAKPLGGVVLLNVPSIDEFTWQICGSTGLALRVLERAKSEDEILRAMNLIFGLVQDNWRISEAFERENAFSTVAWLLRSKPVFRRRHIKDRINEDTPHGSFALELLRFILVQVGYKEQDTSSSVILNPLAYRALIVDSDIWRLSDGATQRLYYKQFVDIVANSQFAQFNVKRLTRMRILKRLINALKSQTVDKDGLPLMLQALKAITVYLPSSETYRSIALYTTYAVSIHKEPSSSTSTPYQRRQSSHTPHGQIIRKTQSSRSLSATAKTAGSSDRVSSTDLGVEVLKLLTQHICEDDSGAHLRKFARTVTNKWLLYLLSSDDLSVLESCMTILSRLLILQGYTYVAKFEETTKNFYLLSRRLKKWWFVGIVWNCCFAVFFGFDILELEPVQHFTSAKLLNTVKRLKSEQIYCRGIFVVITTMLEGAAECHAKAEIDNPAPPLPDVALPSHQETKAEAHSQYRSNDIALEVCKCLSSIHNISGPFRDYCSDSNFVRDMIRTLSKRQADAETALSPLEGRPVPDILNIDEPGIGATPSPNSIMRASTSSHSPQTTPAQIRGPRRRHSSFVLVPRNESLQGLRSSISDSTATTYADELDVDGTPSDGLFRSTTNLLVDYFAHQIQQRKDFTGLGLFFKAPPCAYRQRAVINSHLILATMLRIHANLESHPLQYNEARALINLARFAVQAFEAYMEGWFIHTALPIVRFNLSLLCHFLQPRVQTIKEIQLCSPSVATVQATFGRASLLHITSSADSQQGISRVQELLALEHWSQHIVGYPQYEQAYLGPLFCAIIRLLPEMSAEQMFDIQPLLKDIAEHRPDDVIGLFVNGDDGRDNNDSSTFQDFLLSLRDGSTKLEEYLKWHSERFQKLVTDCKNRHLMPFIAEEETQASRSAELRVQRRKERLEQWHLEDLANSHSWTEHRMATKTWTDNIVHAEHYKLQRSIQDQQESFEHLKFTFEKELENMHRFDLGGSSNAAIRWQLDECEGRDRMRLRLSPLLNIEETGYEPKTVKTMRRATNRKSASSSPVVSSKRETTTNQDQRIRSESLPQTDSSQQMESSKFSIDATGDSYEIIAEPSLDEEEEDKNRKVMRSLQRGEKVMNVFNVSRIVGLEAHEGLLIIGKTSLYLVDGLFQRNDGEVVDVSQAPQEERDQYTKVLSGHELDAQTVARRKYEPTRHWPWSEILVFSKRNFLTRSVAVEVFFTDGRSYLLTTIDDEQRNELYSDLLKYAGPKRPNQQTENEDAWRLEVLKNPGEGASRFSQLLGPMVGNPMTKRWVKGEVSNFHYLMWINSQAGRTFNDLTQYPVFPWVIADYTSEHLDLSNPRSFRDLSKPMGCQNIERSESFRERYATLADMDEHTPPFHYGTHYSSAMIVTSFLIRLQPFVQSHVLLQGGSFDHANRLFHSIEQAWRSASREGLSDVRELIPEFFYLPDFLNNVNKYNFGLRDGDNEVVDNVRLPPWAKGDPEIFISKHREALESPYVSQNIHAWIDLIFGFKQRGEAAIEATNVFHYLSYPGAKDLDKIKDKHERAATIGIIHNFGQTPKQIFIRPHDRREVGSNKSLDVFERIQSLARLRAPVQDISRCVSSLSYAKQLIASRCGTCSIPPLHNAFVDWVYPDHSVRFWSSDKRKMLGLYEQLHNRPVLTARFTAPDTLLTASEDGTVSAWRARVTSDTVELHPRVTLFGHRTSVAILAFSKAYSILLSASTDGVMLLWDLNRLEYIRRIDCGNAIVDARISESSGRIIVATGNTIRSYTLNGRHLLKQTICDASDGDISSCNFYQQSDNAWYANEVILTGHRRGKVKIWSVQPTDDGQWSLSLINVLSIDESSKRQKASSVTALLAFGSKVWAGDELGRVFEWNAVR